MVHNSILYMYINVKLKQLGLDVKQTFLKRATKSQKLK